MTHSESATVVGAEIQATMADFSLREDQKLTRVMTQLAVAQLHMYAAMADALEVLANRAQGGAPT